MLVFLSRTPQEMFLPWSNKNRIIENVSEMAPNLPKDAALLGDLGKRVFGLKFILFKLKPGFFSV